MRAKSGGVSASRPSVQDVDGSLPVPPAMQWAIATLSFVCGVVAVWVGLSWTGGPLPVTAEVNGFTGNAGEWELTATLTRAVGSRELSGPMKMTHVGWCSQEGPQEKTGELHVRQHPLFARIDATVKFDGVACSYQGSLSDAYEGKMTCPDRRPMQLLMWIR